ncbi:hypothetical protein [Brevibacterium album]|uniref:hypothetical protein n=1 Tax=Brevibacterium album TaxID=417948 RepID=UPI0003F4B039|nr:hypothetical protein [Brevibacterium album]
MTPTIEEALHALQTHGRIELRGAASGWAQLTLGLTAVLLGLVALLIVAPPLVLLIVFLTGTPLPVPAVIGGFGVMVLGAFMFALVRSMRKRHRQYRDTERSPVVIDGRGLTLRGVGPLPWQDLGPAENRLVMLPSSGSHTLRAVMMLTPSGLHNVNTRMPLHLRPLLSPAVRRFGRGQQHSWVFVPGVRNMSTREVIELLNRARALMGAWPQR